MSRDTHPDVYPFWCRQPHSHEERAATCLVMAHVSRINGLLNLGLGPSLRVKGFCRMVSDSGSHRIKDFRSRFEGVVDTGRHTKGSKLDFGSRIGFPAEST